jgi:hypothetical protein
MGTANVTLNQTALHRGMGADGWPNDKQGSWERRYTQLYIGLFSRLSR